jgi:cytochrome bd-type quinol oxidase subunit 2
MLRGGSSLIVGIVLVALGLATLWPDSELSAHVRRYWWVVLVVIGVLALLEAAWASRKSGNRAAWLSVIAAIAVAVCTIGIAFFPGVEWTFAIAALIIAAGASLVLLRR